MFPAIHDRQGSYPLVLTRVIVVPIAVMAISMAVFGCVSLFFPGGWVNLFPAMFLLVIAAGFGYVARRLYTHPDRVWPKFEKSEPNLARWQQLALEHLPKRQATILDAENHADLWQLLKELVATGGHNLAQTAQIEDIFRYAWWCVIESGDPDLRIEVETCFYEDLPVYSDLEERIPEFVTVSQFERLESVMSARLTDEEFESFRSRFFGSLERETE